MYIFTCTGEEDSRSTEMGNKVGAFIMVLAGNARGVGVGWGGVGAYPFIHIGFEEKKINK